MSEYCRIFLFLLLFIHYSFSYGQSSFQRTFGTNGDESVYTFTKTDNGYLFAGTTNNAGAGNDDILIIETDLNYTILSSKTLGGAQEDFPRSVIRCADGGYAIIGSTYSFGAGNEEIILIKLAQDLSFLWAKTYGSGNPDRGFCIIEDAGSFVIGATTHGGDGALVLKTDQVGNLIWSNTYGFHPNSARCFSAVMTDMGNYMFTGPFEQGGGTFDYMSIEVNPTGILESASAFNAGGNDHPRDVIRVDGDGYYFFGHSTSFGNGSWDFLIVKTDLNGTIQWSKNYASADDLWSSQIILTSDNQLLITGHSGPFSDFGNDIVVMKCDVSGNLLWAKSYGGSDGENQKFGNHETILEIQSGQYLTIAQTSSFGAGGQDIFLVGFDSQGGSECNYHDLSITESSVSLINEVVALPVNSFIPTITQPSIQIGSINLKDSILCPQIIFPVASFVASETAICQNDCISFTDFSSNQPLTWHWTFESANPIVSSVQNPANICYSSTGCFDVQLIVSNGDGSDTLLLPDYICVCSIPVVDLGNDTTICQGDFKILNPGTQYSSYKWQDGSDQPTYTVETMGEYWLEVMNDCGCANADTILVEIQEVPALYIGNDTASCGEFSILLDAGGQFDQYLWQDGSTDHQLMATNYGFYWVEAFKGGCEVSDSIMISEECPSQIWFPNVFTPNSDGRNDRFLPVYENIIRYQVYIFNRWGQLIYESKDIDEGWDGKFKGQMCSNGTYFFVAHYFGSYSESDIEASGSITLLR